MGKRETVTLFCPVGEADFGTVWKRYVLRGVIYEEKRLLSGCEATLYADGCTKSFCGGGASPFPAIVPGCAVSRGVVGEKERYSGALPDAEVLKVVSVSSHRRGTPRLWHVRADLG